MTHGKTDRHLNHLNYIYSIQIHLYDDYDHMVRKRIAMIPGVLIDDNPADKWRNNDIIITSKRLCDVVLT